jgi:hypothetical protein
MVPTRTYTEEDPTVLSLGVHSHSIIDAGCGVGRPVDATRRHSAIGYISPIEMELKAPGRIS